MVHLVVMPQEKRLRNDHPQQREAGMVVQVMMATMVLIAAEAEAEVKRGMAAARMGQHLVMQQMVHLHPHHQVARTIAATL